MDTFYDKQSTQEMIIGAGEVIALKMFNIESSSSTSLFSGKTAKAATIAKAVSLPPTSYAAAQHSLRCYHQIQCWLGHTEYGYCVKTACLGKSSFGGWSKALLALLAPLKVWHLTKFWDDRG